MAYEEVISQKFGSACMCSWKLSRTTKKAFSDDGCFKTGNVGHVHVDGLDYEAGRAKEFIEYKGFWVVVAGYFTNTPMFSVGR